MTLRQRLAAADRLQKSRWFKIIASAVVAVLGIGVLVTYGVARARDAGPAVQVDEAVAPKAPSIDQAKTPEERQLAEQIAARRTSAENTARMLNDVLAARSDPTAVGVGVAVAAGLALSVIWIGLGLTGLLVLGGIGLIAAPLRLAGDAMGVPRLHALGSFLGAIGILGFAFVVLVELLRVLLSSSNPVTAIARNVVNEAVRLKVSLVFIVLLLFTLAALPGLLDEANPLRYRVQSFLQYGTSGSFALIAILCLFLAVGTVAFEQRDRVIWQTMTKPVRPWQYVLGKWLGVSGVGAVLLTVSCSGIFLFTEYLREQPAIGEVRPFEARDGVIAPDRFVLETQVLSARNSVKPIVPEFTPESLKQAVDTRVQRLGLADPNFRDTPAERDRITNEIRGEARAQFFTIEANDRRTMRFEGLTPAKELGRPVTLRYKVSAGSDDPRHTHRLTFYLPNLGPRVEEVPLGQALSIDIGADAISSEGVLEVEVINADIISGRSSDQTMSFSAEDGLEVFYTVGSYRGNFLRAVLILWLKIALLSMIGITAATFLSFPVASLVSFGAFFVAESAGFLIGSLEYWDYRTKEGGIDPFRLVVWGVAKPVAELFRGYSSVDPTLALVDGRLLAFRQMAIAIAALGLMMSLLYVAAVAIFRRRELAIYSGQT